MKRRPEPLYRKVNTCTHGVRHFYGGDHADQRHARSSSPQDELPARQGMHGQQQRGLDYSPLFHFLLSKVGQHWDLVYSQAVSRLDKPEPIFWMVARTPDEQRDWFCIGEASYFSGLYIDEAGLLQKVNPAIDQHSLTPGCRCCTHSFNGQRFSRRFED